MTFDVNIKEKSLKFVSSLEKHDMERLRDVIFILKIYPIPINSLDIAKLKGEKNKYRIRKVSLELFMKLYGNKELY